MTASTSAIGTAGFHILLVEDHEDTANIMSRLLRSFGHDVQTAGSVATALQAVAASRPFDLLISDIGLPDGSGVDLMRQLRAQYDIRGIALTGWGLEDVEDSKAAGFVEHLKKPVDLMHLRTVIDRVAKAPPTPPTGT